MPASLKVEKFGVYLADLGAHIGTEPGKIRPVVVIQTDLLNNVHPSTLICPLTTKVVKSATILRVSLARSESGLQRESDILVDQIRAIDNRRFKKRIGKLTSLRSEKLLSNLRILVLN